MAVGGVDEFGPKGGLQLRQGVRIGFRVIVREVPIVPAAAQWAAREPDEQHARRRGERGRAPPTASPLTTRAPRARWARANAAHELGVVLARGQERLLAQALGVLLAVATLPIPDPVAAVAVDAPPAAIVVGAPWLTTLAKPLP